MTSNNKNFVSTNYNLIEKKYCNSISNNNNNRCRMKRISIGTRCFIHDKMLKLYIKFIEESIFNFDIANIISEYCY